MKRIIVTTADENFADLLIDLIDSLRQFPEPLADAIGVLDVGLSAGTLDVIAPHVTTIVQPDWRLPVPASLRVEKSYLRQSTARPFLREYFPGFDLYLWLDSDLWVQDSRAIDQLFMGAASRGMAIVPHEHPAYRQFPEALTWRLERLDAAFGGDFSHELATKPYFNSGVFAIAHDAPHWDSWAGALDQALRSENMVEIEAQSALNYAVWSADLPVEILPATANWLCHLATPGVDPTSGKLCEPAPPHDRIGIVHLTGPNKHPGIAIHRGSETLTTTLNYRNRQKIIQFVSNGGLPGRD